MKHLAGLKEAEEVEEELDARVFGNFLHNVMHRFYVELIEAKSTKEIVAGDLEKTTTSSKIDLLIDKEFINHYKLDPEIEVEYKGQRLLVKEIVKQFAERIILLDKEYAPFSIEMLEQENYSVEHEITTGKNYQVVKLAGRIDRVDKKDGVVRVIDYKTGADSLTFKNIESFFMREGKRNKAAFQTVLYSWMYHKKESEAGIKILQLTPGLINRTSLFENQFQWAFKLQQLKQQLNDVQPFLGEFEDRLSNLLQELFDPSVSFIQTKELNNCKFCAYKNICRR